MSVAKADVERWVEAGLIDAAAGERILAFESSAGPSAPQFALPGVTELAAYLGAAIVGAGVTALVVTNWEHLGTAPRLAVPAFGGLVALAAGWLMSRSGRAQLARAGSVAWLLAGALFTGSAAIAAEEAGWAGEDVALTAGLVAVAVAVALWAGLRTHVQVVGIAGAGFVLSTALGGRAGEDWTLTVLGFAFAGFGLAALLATEAGILVPRPTARVFAGAGLLLGAIYSGIPPGPALAELVALAAAVVLVGASLWAGTLIYMVFGVLTAFAGLVTLVLRQVDDPTLAALALIAIGLALLVAIALVARRPPRDRGAGKMKGPGYR